MKIIANGINSIFLDQILNEADEFSIVISEVKIAMNSANGEPRLLDWCRRLAVKTTVYCHYDATVPVAPAILDGFLRAKNPLYNCRLVAGDFHPNIIWWVGLGAYIGSASLTENGWTKDFECGVFVTDIELGQSGTDVELRKVFGMIHQKSHPLNKKIVDQMTELEKARRLADKTLGKLTAEFEKVRLVPEVLAPNSSDQAKVAQVARQEFITDWHQAQRYLKNIAARVSSDEFRPKWVQPKIPSGIQADRFLNGYYLDLVQDPKDYNKHPFDQFYLRNLKNPEGALIEAMTWWSQTASAPNYEDLTMYEWYPVLESLLSRSKVYSDWGETEVLNLVSHVNSMRDHAVRSNNVGLRIDQGFRVSPSECNVLYSRILFAQRSKAGKGVVDLIRFVLFGGSSDQIAERIWYVCNDQEYMLPQVGINVVAEIAGWAFPDQIPIRNGRTSRALRALGFDVQIY